MCLAVNAIGNSIPPYFVFPRKNFKDHFLNGDPIGSVGSVNQSGWMQEEDFLLYLQHFINHAKPSEKNRVLLVLDNHSSHISISAINYCRENFITMLSFPPHTSHKLQPLDRSVFGPFKHRFNTEYDRWCKSHPGVRMTIYNLPFVTAEAISSVIAENIKAGFKCTGIYPFNPNIFSDEEFSSATVTDMPLSNDKPDQLASSCSSSVDNLHHTATLRLNSPIDNSDGIYSNGNNYYSFLSVKPLPRAPSTQKARKGRVRSKTAIYTDTPEKFEIEVRANAKKPK
ncbi:GSCOCG00010248001-RA-CDS, partial [Cotesia congregata]